MSNGTAPIAVTEINNGSVYITDAWGAYAPDELHSVELTVKATVHGESAGNIHAQPVERETTVYLTYEELFDLARQVAEFQREAGGDVKLRAVGGAA